MPYSRDGRNPTPYTNSDSLTVTWLISLSTPYFWIVSCLCLFERIMSTIAASHVADIYSPYLRHITWILYAIINRIKCNRLRWCLFCSVCYLLGVHRSKTRAPDFNSVVKALHYSWSARLPDGRGFATPITITYALWRHGCTLLSFNRDIHWSCVCGSEVDCVFILCR